MIAYDRPCLFVVAVSAFLVRQVRGGEHRPGRAGEEEKEPQQRRRRPYGRGNLNGQVVAGGVHACAAIALDNVMKVVVGVDVGGGVISIWWFLITCWC